MLAASSFGEDGAERSPAFFFSLAQFGKFGLKPWLNPDGINA
ncbi:hypothetical protein [Thermoleptolyngbya sp. M55_K2018_002]|nr:hypothetical protein [Thermoleptolyngbya sp. M55_K2018_002]